MFCKCVTDPDVLLPAPSSTLTLHTPRLPQTLEAECEPACWCSGALGPAVDWLSLDVSDAVRALISEMHSQFSIVDVNRQPDVRREKLTLPPSHRDYYPWTDIKQSPPPTPPQPLLNTNLLPTFYSPFHIHFPEFFVLQINKHVFRGRGWKSPFHFTNDTETLQFMDDTDSQHNVTPECSTCISLVMETG